MPFFLLFQDITDRPVSLNTTVGQIVTWIVIGLIAGMFANLFTRGRMSLTALVLLGLVGAFIGGFIFDRLGIDPSGALGGELVIEWIDVVAAIIGSLIVFALVGAMFRRRRYD
ncbi:GlsB/YeaQ/YmgE family stress response membrane protein [Aggregatilinea lenta]|uniref:GlsB/YeaQ/YmgE family stress response membrane protein n=1 Tax=Aggregatilinea lenta TaxID=913108 RepID=UPI000E5C2B54|nr:GlsB/YeaQ/YmgE family stress response membrane protein [Aggregatilinea lenta]